MITLRPYQEKAVSAIPSGWQNGKLRQLVGMATGCGKTEVGFGVLDREAGIGHLERALWMVHRRELVYQPYERIQKHWPRLAERGVGIMMADHDDCDAGIVIATVQTLNAGGRLRDLLDGGAISHVVVDEAHHATAASYRRVLQELGIIGVQPDLYDDDDALDAAEQRWTSGNARLLGLTATPRRTDGTALSLIFDDVAYRLNIRDAIRMGALCPFSAYGVRLDIDVSGVDLDGTRQNVALGDLLKAKNVEELVFESWLEKAADRPTIAFTASVSQANSLAQYFESRGVRAASISYRTKKSQRPKLLDQFRTGEIQLICNCMLLTEGCDFPAASCLLQVHPTRSDLIYIQMAGRVLRTHPTKKESLIIDFVPAGGRNLIMAGDLLDGTPLQQKRVEEKAEDDGILSPMFAIGGDGLDADPDNLVIEMLDLLGDSSLAWFTDGNLATASVSKEYVACIALPGAKRDEAAEARLNKADAIRRYGDWRQGYEKAYSACLRQHHVGYRVFAIRSERDKETGRTTGEWTIPLGRADEWESAQAIVEAWAPEYIDPTLAKKGKAWRRKTATAGQTKCLRRLIKQSGGDPSEIKNDLKRGRASRLISHFKAISRLKRDGFIT